MKSNEPDILVQRFLDGDLSGVEAQEALHRIADDNEARELLQFELRMTQDLASSRSAQPPPDFADRTMNALGEAEVDHSLGERLRAWWTTVTTPVSLRLRPASALVTVLLVGIVAWMVWPSQPEVAPVASTESPTASTVQQATTQSSGQTSSEKVWIRFVYTASDADSVAVAGDFSQWEPISLSPRTVNGETVWTGLVPVRPGEHEYQFVIDGERWVTDPLAPVKRDDGFGAQNAVLKI